MSLSGQEERDFAAGGWQFGSLLTTDHVWDSFIILTLLEYHQRNKTYLQVPNVGDQRDRFTAAMAARNEEVILSGQDVVGHCCDKCMREWTRPDGSKCKWTMLFRCTLANLVQTMCRRFSLMDSQWVIRAVKQRTVQTLSSPTGIGSAASTAI
jgi:hypothetical protein